VNGHRHRDSGSRAVARCGSAAVDAARSSSDTRRTSRSTPHFIDHSATTDVDREDWGLTWNMECGIAERKATSALTGGLRGEDRQDHEHAHLNEHHGSRPSVPSAVQLEVQGAVGPTDPDQDEDDGELDDTAERDVVGEVVGRLGYDGHVHEVVEQLQRADGALDDRFTVRSRRTPQPASEAAGEPLVRHRVNVASADPPTSRHSSAVADLIEQAASA
jgi:hypothetical protein